MRLFGGRLPIATGVAVTAGLIAAFSAPPDRFQGNLQRLMYVHVPAAWIAFLAFGITLVASLLWLWRRYRRYDHLAVASVEVGVFFTGLTLVLGSMWGKPVWGVWWTWDPRLVTTAIMFFVYLGYLALRRATVDPVTRARRSAVFGVVAFAQVPIVHMSVLWWRTLHQPPTVLKPGSPSIEPAMLAALLINVAAFTLLFAVLLRVRYRISVTEQRQEEQRERADREVAGAAVSSPRRKGDRTDVNVE
ncbi:cytochrome c biogenesis protein CcsA [Actinopolyspora halophila]|uniref:cytochrome c biogenesis protein CcsA n=1 Tax=Actinopolyspora halophila TaxID=1850 RepID=UPI0003606927|nr:cytochrome c biogenesis protein CcsA [Actinopolyspora halophila]